MYEAKSEISLTAGYEGSEYLNPLKIEVEVAFLFNGANTFLLINLM